MGVNKVILVGRLGADPETFSAPTTDITTFSVATDHRWRDREGNLQSETQWTKIAVFGKRALACGEHRVKGQQVYVEGRLKTSSWEDGEGVKRWKTEVIARDVVFLARPAGTKTTKPEPDWPDEIPF